MISASIVLYKHTYEDIKKTINSLLKSPSISTITIVDNGYCEWAKNIESLKIKYIKSPKNGGYGYGHNIAIFNDKKNRQQFHLVCNPDIYFQDGELEKLLSAVEDNEAGLYMPNVTYPNNERQELCKLLPTPINLFLRRFVPIIAEKLDFKYLLRDADYNQSFFAPSLSGCFMLFRTDALLDVGGFDERYFMYLEDIDLSRRVAERYGAMYIHNATVVHEFQKASYKDKKLLTVHISSAIKYFNKWGWIFDKGRKELNRKCLAKLPIIHKT